MTGLVSRTGRVLYRIVPKAFAKLCIPNCLDSARYDYLSISLPAQEGTTGNSKTDQPTMVDLHRGTKNNELQEFGMTKAWEKRQDWSNPFDSGEESLRRQRKEERRKHKKSKAKRSRRRHMTEEEYTELSSKADSMLDDLLGDDDEEISGKMPQVREGSFEGDDSTNAARVGSNPFDDSEVEEENNGEEINKEEYAKLMKGVVKPSSTAKGPKNPFADDDSLDQERPKNPFADDDSVDHQKVKGKSMSVEPPPVSSHNPFEDDSVAESAELVDEEEEKQPVSVSKTNGKGVVKSSKIDSGDLKRKTTDTTHENEESDASLTDDEGDEGEEDADEPVPEEEEEDIVESSKRLLRMVDQRLQYQQHSDEVKKLRETIDTMKYQAEAMSEQLRRAVETKCDLVLAQTEMERCHEQNLIAKDDEIHDMKVYIQQLMEYHSINELNFMNEIASMSKRMDEMTERHQQEVADKDLIISQLEAKVKSMEIEASERNTSAMSAFRSRFIESVERPAHAAITAI